MAPFFPPGPIEQEPNDLWDQMRHINPQASSCVKTQTHTHTLTSGSTHAEHTVRSICTWEHSSYHEGNGCVDTGPRTQTGRLYTWLRTSRLISCSWNDQHRRWEKARGAGWIFRGPVGRRVPLLQTHTVCLLIRSQGCHAIHHPAAHHAAPLSRILRLQSGFHTHPLMTKPDTGTDSSSSVGSQWQEIRGGWYPGPWASANPRL